MLPVQSPLSSGAYRLGGMALFLAAAGILTALGFEHIGGYAPCPLCLMQRYAYYAGIPLLFVGMALVAERPKTSGYIFLAVAAAFLFNAALGGYHSGVEWKFWPGPDTCGTVQALPKQAGNLLEQMETQKVIRCDEASWRFLWLSFAGWNVVLSLLIAVVALKAAMLAAIDNAE